MTCEIAIINRQAIALAADSATTVTQWIKGKPQPRYSLCGNTRAS